MNFKLWDRLLSKRDVTNFGSLDMSLLSEYRTLINDEFYFKVMLEFPSGGFFFHKALQLYGFNEEYHFRNIKTINETAASVYGHLWQNLLAFGQDVFGNQFAFELPSKKVVGYNCETADCQEISENFPTWISVILSDFDYYTGESFAMKWCENNTLKMDERLCPRIPFVIGGEYALSNFYALQFPKYLSYNADLARQIAHLPDGQPVKLVIRNSQKNDNSGDGVPKQ
jgi:hypothetical protein